MKALEPGGKGADIIIDASADSGFARLCMDAIAEGLRMIERKDAFKIVFEIGDDQGW